MVALVQRVRKLEKKMADRSHLEDADFKDAMALLGDDSKKQ